MAGFLKKLAKGAAAFMIGGNAGVMALAIKKGIAKRKEKKAAKSLDNMQGATAQLITGDAAYYHQELNRRKAKQRNILFKIKEAKKLINRGQTVKAAMNATNLTESEVKEPTIQYL